MNWKKQIGPQALHAGLALLAVIGLIAEDRPWLFVSSSVAWIVAIVVHVVGRASKNKPIVHDAIYGLIVSVMFIITLLFMTAYVFADPSWTDVFYGTTTVAALAFAREILQLPMERKADAALDIGVTSAAGLIFSAALFWINV